MLKRGSKSLLFSTAKLAFAAKRSTSISISASLAHGDTPLHVLMRQFEGAKKINDFVTEVGVETASEMAKTANDNGELPIDLVPNPRDYDDLYDEKTATELLLYSLMKTNKLKKLSEPVTLEYPIQNRELYGNLLISRDIANRVRKLIPESYTHPQTNNYSKRDKLTLLERTEAMIKEVSQTDCNPKINAEVAIKHGVGNCRDFSCAAKLLLKEYDHPPHYLCSIENGDHLFLVIGAYAPAESFKIKDLKWGEDVVICDPWGGFAIPGHQLNKLMDYREVSLDKSEYLNVTYRINTNFHTFAPKIHTPRLFNQKPCSQQASPKEKIIEKARNLPRV